MNATSTDGVQVHFDVSGRGRGILLLHGFGDDRSLWTRSAWVARLQNEFTVITMDFRGCGESGKPDSPSAYSLESHFADIDAVLAACGVCGPSSMTFRDREHESCTT